MTLNSFVNVVIAIIGIHFYVIIPKLGLLENAPSTASITATAPWFKINNHTMSISR